MAVKKKAATTKKAAPKKTAAVAAPAKPKAIKTKMTKAGMINNLVEKTGLAKKDVVAIYDALSEMAAGSLMKNSIGEFSLPGMIKLTRKKKPATKKRTGRNPATGEEIVIPARPASWTLRARVLAGLKKTCLD